MSPSREYVEWATAHGYDLISVTSFDYATNFYMLTEVYEMTKDDIAKAESDFKTTYGISIKDIQKDDWGISYDQSNTRR